MANNSLNNDSVPLVPDFGGTGVANVGTITVGGNTAFSGSFTFTGTVTGNTSVTFPTSGTLATTAGASGIVNSGTANQIAYYATSGTAVSGLTGGNGTVLVTNSTGVPSMLANPGASGRALISINADTPAWTTASYPNTVTQYAVLYANVTNGISSVVSTARSAFTTASTGEPTWVPLTDGQIIVGSTAGSPAAASITAGSGITVTPGSNSITIAATASGSGTVNSGTANEIAYYATSGTAVSGLAGANGSVLVTNNTGVPSMLANPAAAGRHLQSANAAIPSWTTSSYADTYAVSTILYASSANTVTGLATANNSVLVTSAGGVPSLSGTLPFTVPVTTGGTGVTTMTTAYAPVISGTTATGALQVASTGLATSGFVLTSNGASAVPSFQAVSAPSGTPVLVRVPMTLAQFLGMRTTPFQIIAAQGANTLIVPISIVYELNMAGVAFAGGGDTGLQYGNTTSLGGNPIAFMASSFITGPSASPGQVVNLPVNFYNASGTVPASAAKTTSVNTAVFASNKTAAYTGGTGATVVINVTYVVVTTT